MVIHNSLLCENWKIGPVQIFLLQTNSFSLWHMSSSHLSALLLISPQSCCPPELFGWPEFQSVNSQGVQSVHLKVPSSSLSLLPTQKNVWKLLFIQHMRRAREGCHCHIKYYLLVSFLFHFGTWGCVWYFQDKWYIGWIWRKLFLKRRPLNSNHPLKNIIFERMKISTSFIARAGVFVVVSELVVPAVVFSNELSSGLSKINGIF